MIEDNFLPGHAYTIFSTHTPTTPSETATRGIYIDLKSCRSSDQPPLSWTIFRPGLCHRLTFQVQFLSFQLDLHAKQMPPEYRSSFCPTYFHVQATRSHVFHEFYSQPRRSRSSQDGAFLDYVWVN